MLTIWTKIAFGNSHGFQAQIEDLHLKYCILGKNSEKRTSGRNLPFAQDPPSKPKLKDFTYKVWRLVNFKD